MAVSRFSDVDLKNLHLAEKPVKVDNVLVVPFEPPLYIQTEETLTATSPLCTRAEDGSCEVLPSLTAKVGGPFLEFLRQFETALLDTAKAQSNKWWPRRNLDAGAVENGLKSYLKGTDVLKMKVDTEVDPLVYDEAGTPTETDIIKPGQKFWAVLKANRVVLGKTEFGMVWRLHQVMHKPVTACVVVPQQMKSKPADNEVAEFA